MKTIALAYHNIGCIGIKALLGNGFEVAGGCMETGIHPFHGPPGDHLRRRCPSH